MFEKILQKEALLTLLLTCFYMLCWFSGGFLSNEISLFGFPQWFVVSCLLLTPIFIILNLLMIKFFFTDIDLDNIKGENK